MSCRTGSTYVIWLMQWRNYNFCPPRQTFATDRSPPLNLYCQFKSTVDWTVKWVGIQGRWFCEMPVHSLITVLIHNSGHFGPPLPFWALIPRHCRGCRWLVTSLGLCDQKRLLLINTSALFAYRLIGLYATSTTDPNPNPTNRNLKP